MFLERGDQARPNLVTDREARAGHDEANERQDLLAFAEPSIAETEWVHEQRKGEQSGPRPEEQHTHDALGDELTQPHNSTAGGFVTVGVGNRVSRAAPAVSRPAEDSTMSWGAGGRLDRRATLCSNSGR